MRKQEPEETSLKELFQQLKQEDELCAPSFAQSWAAAQSQLGPHGQAWRMWRFSVLAVSVLILAGVLGWVMYKPSTQPNQIANVSQPKTNEAINSERQKQQVQYEERERPAPQSKPRLRKPRLLTPPVLQPSPRDVARIDTFALPPPEGKPFFDLETTRHLEKAQVLLRSFKNTSFSKGENLNYEKHAAKELLYRNILLRREAEAVENTPAKSLLRNLEPLLLDLANLPAKPASGELRFIKERVRKSEIVAVLQVYATLTASVE